MSSNNFPQAFRSVVLAVISVGSAYAAPTLEVFPSELHLKGKVDQKSFVVRVIREDGIHVDVTSEAKVVFENLYPDVDIAETLSNVSGKHIKQVFEDKVVFEDGSEVVMLK